MGLAAIWVGGGCWQEVLQEPVGFTFASAHQTRGQFPAAVDICGLSFLGWEIGAGGLSHWGCWDRQTVTEFTGEALPALPLRVLGPAGVVGRKTTLYMPTTVYPVLAPKLNTLCRSSNLPGALQRYTDGETGSEGQLHMEPWTGWIPPPCVSCCLGRLLTMLSHALACAVPSAWDTIPGPVRP